MKKLATWVAVVAALAIVRPAEAAVGTSDPVPSATLLLPYFEVDLNDPHGNGVNTLFSIQNTSATAVLVHMVFWTDVGVPTIRHNIYLTGYDVESVDLQQVFLNGTLTTTASDGQDPQDTSQSNDGISNQGPFSQDINFASCNGQLPARGMNAFEIQQIRAAHTGAFTPYLDGCAAQNLGDNIARGYITFDVVNNCTLRYPSDAGYLVSGGSGDATNQPVLTGEWSMVDRNQQTAWSDRLVHIEAAAQDPLTNTPGNYTFYGRYVATVAADNREALATSWAARFEASGPVETDLVIWRDPATGPQNRFNCNSVPSWYPLSPKKIVAFDEAEEVDLMSSIDVIGMAPAQTNRISVGGATLPVTFAAGWLFLDLSAAIPTGQFAPYNQSYVNVVRRAVGIYETGVSAFQLDNAVQPNPPDVP